MRYAMSLAAVLSGCVFLCGPSGADEKKVRDKPPSQSIEASIPFANHGGIYDWQVENDHSIFIQDERHKWYRATLLGNCFDLPFAETIGFVTNPSGSFDKFSAIRVRGQNCPLMSLVPTVAPPKKGRPPKAVAPAAPPGAQPAAPPPPKG